MARRLYLAGPMTGIPLFNFPAFVDAAARLTAAGYVVDSPAQVELDAGFDPAAPVADYTHADYVAAMRRDCQMVLDADAVAVLPGWELSKGARAEVALAYAVGHQARSVEAWLVRAEREAARARVNTTKGIRL